MIIRTSSQALSHKLSTRSTQKSLRRSYRRLLRKSRKRIVRYAILTGNLAVLVAVILFIAGNSSSSAAVQQNALGATTGASAMNPLDQISSADIAVHVARIANLDADETTAIVNEADSANAQLAMATTDNTVIAKPQVVNTALKSRKDIQQYTVQDGDTLAGIAAKFNVTSDSIRWSNGLSGSTVPSGKKLYISPLPNGIVYIVKAGDTPDSLAQKFQASKDQIIDFNDAYKGTLPVGEAILIPDGKIQAPVRTAISYASSFSWSSGYTPIYGGNGYARGYCTWYVASRIAVPNNWGNANTWDNLARISGWTVSSVPVAGAIGQTDAGYDGHVAVVEAVSPDGTQIKYSDMNGLAGWGQVGYSGWVPASHFQHYIYH